MLKDVPAERFSLPDGVHWFSASGVDGETIVILLRLWGRGKKFRSAQFDLCFSDYNIDDKPGEAFREEIEPFIEAAGKILPGTIVMLPHGGGSTLTFSIPRAPEGFWLKRAAEYLTDSTNLYSIVPNFR
ncbi:MAG TPA: hypothetical protein VNY05_32450 [Candidatus Acidoferrales bacterium]|nr:hypothetical protein [Candidatus Acidoferrales bacterium]